MALTHTDTFRAYGSSLDNLATEYTLVESGDVSISDTGGPSGNGVLTMGGTAAQYMYKQVSDLQYWAGGFRFMHNGSDTTPNQPFFIITSSNDSTPSVADTTYAHMRLYLSAGQMRVYTDGNTLISQYNVVTLADNKWYDISWDCNFDSAAGGWVKVWVGNTLVALLEDYSTQANTYARDRFLFGAGGNTIQCNYSDVWIKTGSTAQTPMQNWSLHWVLPNADSAQLDFTQAPAGGNHYQKVDEFPFTLDDDFVYGTTATNTERFGYGNIPTLTGVASIEGVGVKSVARKSDASAKTMNNVIFENVTEATGSNSPHTLSETYAIYSDYFETNPDTASAWTEAEVNAMEAGVEVQS